MSDQPAAPTPDHDRPNRWVGPLALVVAVAAPVAILVSSNPESVPVSWAGFSWEAPLWLVLAITFAAGALLTPLFRWFLRGYLRRRRRLSEQLKVRRQATAEAERTLRDRAREQERGRDEERDWS